MPVPAAKLDAPSSVSERREQLGQLLRCAFPLGDDGSFTGILDAIRTEPGGTLNEPANTLVQIQGSY